MSLLIPLMERRLTVPGRFERLEQIAKFIERAGHEAGLDESAIYHCQLAVDEACTNIIQHGYGGEGRGPIEIVCEPGDGEILITLRDRAQPFDPTSVPTPNLNTADLDDLQVGGLGVYFIRRVMDGIQFSYERGGNKLVMFKRREAP